MQSRRSVVLGLVTVSALSACGGLGNKQSSLAVPVGQTSQQEHVVQAIQHAQYVAPEIHAAALRGDLAAFTADTNAFRANAIVHGTRLYRMSTPGACRASVSVKSCYAIVPVLPGGRALVDVSRSSATYLVP